MEEIFINNKRHYRVPNGNIYPSVTTVLSILSEDSIANWRKKKGVKLAEHIGERARSVGTEYHRLIETYLNKEETETDNLYALAHFNNIKPFLDRITNIRVLEGGLWSDDLRMAGRTDCIADFDGIPSVIDFKTSEKRKIPEYIKGYNMQGTAYSLMWKERCGEDLQNVVILVSSADNFRESFTCPTTLWEKPLRNIRNIYDDSYIESWQNMINVQKKNA